MGMPPNSLREINNPMQRWEHTGFPIQDVHADQESLGAQFKLSIVKRQPVTFPVFLIFIKMSCCLLQLQL